MGEPLPDDPDLLRAMFDEARKFLEDIEGPRAAYHTFRSAYMRVINDPDEATWEAEYLDQLERELNRAFDRPAANLTLLNRHITDEEGKSIRQAALRSALRAVLKDAYREERGMSFLEFDRKAPFRDIDNPLEMLSRAIRRIYRDIAAKLAAASQCDPDPSSRTWDVTGSKGTLCEHIKWHRSNFRKLDELVAIGAIEIEEIPRPNGRSLWRMRVLDPGLAFNRPRY